MPTTKRTLEPARRLALKQLARLIANAVREDAKRSRPKAQQPATQQAAQGADR